MLSHMLRGAAGNQGSTDIVVVATTTYFTAVSTSSLTMDVPSGTVSGDLMIAMLTKSGGSDTYTQPSGWTELIDVGTSNRSFMLAYKVAGASEPADYTWTTTGTGNNKAGNIITFRNASYDTSAGTTAVNFTFAATRTASFNNSWLILIGRTTSSSVTITYAGATTIVSDSDGNSPSTVIQYKAVNAGATGSIEGTYSSSSSVISASLVIYNS